MKVIVYRLEYRDGAIEIALSYVHRAYLCFLAGRGGEARFNYTPLSEEQRRHFRELIDPFRCIVEHEIVGDASVIHRLTAVGRNLVDEINKAGGPSGTPGQ